MNEAVGMMMYSLCADDFGNYTKQCVEKVIEVNNFTLDKISRGRKISDDELKGYYFEYIYNTQLNWDNFSVEIDSSENLLWESSLARIQIITTSKVKHDESCTPGSISMSCNQNSYANGFNIYVPKNRVTSCHKALLHLKELMKEEDPFGN
jgi:hypothetical protein